MQKFKVAAIQLTSTEDIEQNLLRAFEICKDAAQAGAIVIGLPENFAFFGRESVKSENYEIIYRQSIEFLEKTSRELEIFLLGGGYPSKSSDAKKYYNTASIFSPKGEMLYTYHKMHLFDSNPGDGVEYKESNTVQAGEQLPMPVQLGDLGKFSSLVCYDLRFPELFRHLSKLGTEVIFLPAAFTKLTGEAHWEVLLRSRAIENLCYVVAPAQTGVHDSSGKRKTYGHSMIIDPWGKIVESIGDEIGYAMAEIDITKIYEARSKIPALSHRRLG
ncbi:carbon-nitrogen hydrolase family protein [Leptospira sp. GIMC2001]|nr:carbon-nitrogen hydrolase family protein [Leptospira sp. GIMC2001]WCL47824.1 carbon-nitrogen hydrolase family protein [Leptospira sp. GIMC2001]